MTTNTSIPAERIRMRKQALSRWDNEGGAGPFGPQQDTHRDHAAATPPAPTDAEATQPPTLQRIPTP